MTGPATLPPETFARRVAGQGVLLFSGFAGAQAMSLVRNAMLGHILAKGDFGIAAILTLLLQLLDNLTDLGVDRLIVQAKDGDEPRFVATNHTALVIRGVLIATILFVTSGAIADFFAVPQAAAAVAAIALVPLLKGLQHLDARRAQRHLKNRPFLSIEVAPQLVALALTWPVVSYVPDFQAVVWLSLAQGVTALVVSHAVAERRYALAFDLPILKRLIDFGWPIWLSAFPLVAVYHGDRIVIGRLLGIEDLAGYSAAFMVAMVPGLIASKVGQSLMLPIFAAARGNAAQLKRQFAALTEATAIAAALYLATAVLAGGDLLRIAFGPNFAGLGGVMAWLAAMWAVRMLQAVPGMLLLAAGETRPFLIAGLIRATALIPATIAAYMGFGLEAVAAMGLLGEVASLAYVAWRMEAHERGLCRIFAQRAAFLLPTGLVAAVALAATSQALNGTLAHVGALALVLATIAVAAAAVMPETRSRVQDFLRA
jgi:O-antigen/teichoic acid export membrane protein